MAVAKQYGFHPHVEARLARLTVADERMWFKLGQFVEPGLLSQPAWQLVFQAAREIASEGAVAASPAYVIQRLLTWSDSGHTGVTDEVLQEATTGLMTPEPTIAEGVQLLSDTLTIVRERMRYGVVTDMLDAFSAGDSFAPFIDRIGQLDVVGTAATTPTVAGTTVFSAIASMGGLHRMPTGIVELDAGLSGGLPKGALGLIIGSSGAGKSIMLSQIAAASLRQGLRTALVSTEIPIEWIAARLISAVIGWPTDAVFKNPMHAKMLIEQAGVDMGLLRMVRMESPPVAHVVSWLQTEGPFDMVVVDYLDMLVKTTEDDMSSSGGYLVGKYTTNYLRNYAEVAETRVWTAAQSKRGKTKNGKHTPLTLDDVADSMHKVRIADVVLGINAYKDLDETWMANISVLKHRMGRAGKICGPYQTQYGVGMVAPSTLLAQSPGFEPLDAEVFPSISLPGHADG